MSLINQVLIDLEKRRASGAERGNLPDYVRALPAVVEEPAHWRVVAAAGFALVLAGALGGYFWSQHGVRHAPRPPAAPVVPPAPPAQAQPQPVAPAPSIPDIAGQLAPTTAMLVDAAMPAPRADAAAAYATPERAPRVPSVAATRRAAAPGRPGAAEAKHASAAAAPPDRSEAADAVQIDKRVRRLTREQQIQMDYEKALAAIRQRRPAEARGLLEAVLQASPGHAAARQSLTALLVDAQAYGEAEQVLQEGLTLAPDDTGYTMALARLQMSRADLAGAIGTLQKNEAHAGRNPAYLAFLAALLQRQQRHAEAIEHFEAALKLRPQTAVWLMGLGISLQAAGRTNDAVAAYRSAKAAGGLNRELQAFLDSRLRQLQ